MFIIISATRPKRKKIGDFFSIRMELAQNAYTYVLKAPSRS